MGLYGEARRACVITELTVRAGSAAENNTELTVRRSTFVLSSKFSRVNVWIWCLSLICVCTGMVLFFRSRYGDGLGREIFCSKFLVGTSRAEFEIWLVCCRIEREF